MEPTRDRDLRDALHRTALAVHRGDPDTLIIDEFGLAHGSVRVDVAVINGALHGYELKSASDTLARLPAQVVAYGAALDRATLVTDPRHLREARKIIPRWWGITLARSADGAVLLEKERDGGENPAPDPFAISQLLWREEALRILEERGRARGVRSATRRVVHRRLADELSLDALRAAVRSVLKARGAWRADARRT